MRQSLILLFSTLFVCAAANAQLTNYPVEDERSSGVPEKPAPELQYIGYSFHRMTMNNIVPASELLRGQVIGRLYGPNSTTTVAQTTLYGESRFVPLFVYRPSIMDGSAVFRALFKIDFTWGDGSYGVGNNSGGGLSGATVNIQTLLANVELKPADTWNVVVGLQRIFDNVRDPNVNTLGTAQTSGSRLMFWGTQGVGVSSYSRLSPVTQLRVGYFKLYETNIQLDKALVLYMADAETRITPLWELGGNFWFVRDRGAGAGGVSILGQGFNSELAAYNGAARLQLNTPLYKANVFWTGVNAAYNRDFFGGRWWGSALGMINYGTIDTTGDYGDGRRVNIFGFTLHGSLYYKYGQTANDRIGIEGLYTSGDPNGASDGKYSGVVTGNTWGSPIGIYSSHRAYLLFPDPQVVNRYYAAVQDISNNGLGVSALFLNCYNNIIPNKLTAKIGAAAALSNEKPAGGGSFIGAELNAEVKYTYRVFLDIGLSAAYMINGDFYDSAAMHPSSKDKPNNPWTMFVTLSWMMF